MLPIKKKMLFLYYTGPLSYLIIS